MKATIISNNKKFCKAQRERNRMHSLNKALDVLRRKLQHSLSYDLRLPKIEALKLAKNYIMILEFMVQGNELTTENFVEILCNGLRQSTAGVLRKIYFEN